MMSLEPSLSPLQVKHLITSIDNTDRFGLFSTPFQSNSNISNAGHINALKAIESVKHTIIIDDVYTFPGGGSAIMDHLLVTDGAKVTI